MSTKTSNERFDMLVGALQEMSNRFGLSIDGTVVRSAAEQLVALQQRSDYYEKDAAAAWDKCEERRLESIRLQTIATRIRDARERDHWNDLDDAVDDLLTGNKAPENETKACIWEDCDQEAVYCPGHAREFVHGESPTLKAGEQRS